MVTKVYRKFSGITAIVSLNGEQLMCIHDYNKVNAFAAYIVRDGLVYSYKSAFVHGGLFYAIYDLTDLSFTKLVLLTEKFSFSTLIDFVYE